MASQSTARAEPPRGTCWPFRRTRRARARARAGGGRERDPRRVGQRGPAGRRGDRLRRAEGLRGRRADGGLDLLGRAVAVGARDAGAPDDARAAGGVDAEVAEDGVDAGVETVCGAVVWPPLIVMTPDDEVRECASKPVQASSEAPPATRRTAGSLT